MIPGVTVDRGVAGTARLQAAGGDQSTGFGFDGGLLSDPSSGNSIVSLTGGRVGEQRFPPTSRKRIETTLTSAGNAAVTTPAPVSLTAHAVVSAPLGCQPYQLPDRLLAGERIAEHLAGSADRIPVRRLTVSRRCSR